jgi:hypothetical protein
MACLRHRPRLRKMGRVKHHEYRRISQSSSTRAPQLRDELECWEDDLPHLQMAEFLNFTQEAIEAHSTDVVRKSFEIATNALKNGDDALLNAIYVSFLEQLDFRSDAGKEALLLMPAELKKGRYDILDYDEKLLGRKLAVDDRAQG